jgi:hypothetical protein
MHEALVDGYAVARNSKVHLTCGTHAAHLPVLSRVSGPPTYASLVNVHCGTREEGHKRQVLPSSFLGG